MRVPVDYATEIDTVTWRAGVFELHTPDRGVIRARNLVLGGGLSNFTAISEGLAQRLPRHLLPVARVPRIERARHGDAGGMRGAAFLHLSH